MNENQIPTEKRRRVLVVEDCPELRASLAAALRSQGYDVAVASDGAEASTWLALNDVDVLLTDIVMPKADGFETMQRASERRCAVVAMSGDARFGAAKYLDMARFLGASDVLMKPFSMQRLREALDTAIEGSRNAAALSARAATH